MAFVVILAYSYCWWFRNPAITTWDVPNLVNNGINYQPWSPDFWTINSTKLGVLFAIQSNSNSQLAATSDSWRVHSASIRRWRKATSSLKAQLSSVSLPTRIRVVTHIGYLQRSGSWSMNKSFMNLISLMNLKFITNPDRTGWQKDPKCGGTGHELGNSFSLEDVGCLSWGPKFSTSDWKSIYKYTHIPIQ